MFTRFNTIVKWRLLRGYFKGPRLWWLRYPRRKQMVCIQITEFCNCIPVPPKNRNLLTIFFAGGSDLGTFQAPKYPPFLTNNVRQTFNLTNQDGMRIAMQKKSDWSPSNSILQAGNRNSSDLKQPIVNGWPWGSKSTSDSDPYTGPPNTGVVRHYEFTIARGTIAPDGYSKDMLLINGQYPGVSCCTDLSWGT